MSANGAGVRVLVVSHDLSLRETYSTLFSQAGYTVEQAEPVFAVARLKVATFSILILDHTVSRDARHALVSLGRLLSPRTKIVALHASATDCGADLVMDSREGNAAILKRVAALLGA